MNVQTENKPPVTAASGSLDFKELQKISFDYQKSKLVPNPEYSIDHVNVTSYVVHMAEYIERRAKHGKTDFIYDCSKISLHLMLKIAGEFKKINPRFIVSTHTGMRRIVVDWSSKNEV
jgi:hypothetical protein